MLYLAETKKQTKNFLGGYKTELKLLACQHSDQTWSALPSEEVFLTEELDREAKDGTLWMLNLSNNRSLQGQPDNAAPELVRQLKKLSRLSDKIKDQQLDIDRWRESLTFQAQELGTREMDIEARESEIEEQAAALSQVEQQKYEVEQSWQRLEAEQAQLTELKQQFGVLLENSAENRDLLQALLQRLGAYPEAISALGHAIDQTRQSSEQQQGLFNAQWEQLGQAESALRKQQEALHKRTKISSLRAQELATARIELDKAKVKLAVEQQRIANHQQLIEHLNSEIMVAEDLQTDLYRLATGSVADDKEHHIDPQHLEQMPLGGLESIVHDLQKELEKLANFVNDQEEELTYKCDEVDEIQARLNAADNYGKLSIEDELSEAQEQKKMLNETLVGQRRNLKERQTVLAQHLKILRRRQGIVEISDGIPNIDLDPAIQRNCSGGHEGMRVAGSKNLELRRSEPLCLTSRGLKPY